MTGDDELRFARQRQWSDLRPCDAAAALAQPADRSPGEAENRGLHLLRSTLENLRHHARIDSNPQWRRAYSDFLGLGQGHCRAD